MDFLVFFQLDHYETAFIVRGFGDHGLGTRAWQFKLIYSIPWVPNDEEFQVHFVHFIWITCNKLIGIIKWTKGASLDTNLPQCMVNEKQEQFRSMLSIEWWLMIAVFNTQTMMFNSIIFNEKPFEHFECSPDSPSALFAFAWKIMFEQFEPIMCCVPFTIIKFAMFDHK